MARKVKEGTKAPGIVYKNGALYIKLPTKSIKDGKTVYSSEWIKSDYEYSPENVKLLSEKRKEMMKKGRIIASIKYDSFGEYVSHYLDVKKRTIQNTTLSAYIYACSHIIKFLGDKKFKELTPKIIEDFYDYVVDGGKRHKRTLKDIKRALKEILKFAVDDKLLQENPAVKATVNKSLIAKYAKPIIEGDDFFSFDEAQLFLELTDDEFHDKDDSQDYFELFYVVLFFALRREEVLGLKWSAMDFGRKELHIRSTVTKGTEINYLDTTKTDSSVRTYPLTDKQVELFQRLKMRENKMRTLFGAKYIENDYIFKNADGSLYHPDTPTKVFRKFRIRHPELPQHVTLHKLRKSCVCILIHMGFDVKAIQKWLGHKDIKVTLQWYAEVKDKEAKKEISEGLKDIYTPKSHNYN